RAIARRTTQAARTRDQDAFDIEVLLLDGDSKPRGPERLVHSGWEQTYDPVSALATGFLHSKNPVAKAETGLTLSSKDELLPPELLQRVSHRSTGNPEHAVKRPIEFHDQENRAGHCQGADEQRDEHRRIWRRKHTKTNQNERQPGDHDHEKRSRNRA